MTEKSIHDIAGEAEQLLSAIAPGAVCIPQEWDGRIDCVIRTPDGIVVGEMVRLADVTEDRIRAAAERLGQRALGIDVKLVDELTSTVRIAKGD